MAYNIPTQVRTPQYNFIPYTLCKSESDYYSDLCLLASIDKLCFSYPEKPDNTTNVIKH